MMFDVSLLSLLAAALGTGVATWWATALIWRRRLDALKLRHTSADHAATELLRHCRSQIADLQANLDKVSRRAQQYKDLATKLHRSTGSPSRDRTLFLVGTQPWNDPQARSASADDATQEAVRPEFADTVVEETMGRSRPGFADTVFESRLMG